MNNDDLFGSIYDSMNRNYSKIEQIAEYLYSLIQKDSSNEMAKEMFTNLVSTMQGELATQKDFIDFYCKAEFKDSLITKVDDKSRYLNDALQDIIDNNR